MLRKKGVLKPIKSYTTAQMFTVNFASMCEAEKRLAMKSRRGLHGELPSGRGTQLHIVAVANNIKTKIGQRSSRNNQHLNL